MGCSTSRQITLEEARKLYITREELQRAFKNGAVTDYQFSILMREMCNRIVQNTIYSKFEHNNVDFPVDRRKKRNNKKKFD